MTVFLIKLSTGLSQKYPAFTIILHAMVDVFQVKRYN